MPQNQQKENWRELGRQLAERRRQLGYGDFRDRARFVRERGQGRVSYRTIQRFENGERAAYPAETKRAVAEIYGVTEQSLRDVIDGGGPLVPSGGAVVPKPGITAAGAVSAPVASDRDAELAAFSAQVAREYPDIADVVEMLLSKDAMTAGDKMAMIAMARALRQARDASGALSA